MTDIPLVLALHGFAVMLISVPFLIGAAMFDKLAERDAWRDRPLAPTSRATHHWYDPVAHPVRTVHEWRVSHARPRRAIL